MIELEFICDTCGFRVADGDGSIRMSFGDLHEYRRAVEDWERRKRGPEGTVSLADLLDHPDPAPWLIQHTVCRPKGADGYEIDVEQVRTWRDLVKWTSHLLEKNWLQSTNWAAVIGAAARGQHGGIVPVAVSGDAA